MQRSFSTYAVFQEFSHPEKAKVLQYIELMYSVNSPFQVIEKDAEKRAAVIKKLGSNIEETAEIKELVVHYINYYESNPKFQNLLMYRRFFYDYHRIASEDLIVNDDDARLKQVKLRDAIVLSCENLERKITDCIITLYPPAIEAAADEHLRQLNKVISMEERVKRNKKQNSHVTIEKN